MKAGSFLSARTFGSIALLCFVTVSCFQTKSNSHYEEVTAIWGNLPLHSSFVEVYEPVTASGFDKAYISKQFQSPTQYQEIRKFYQENLTRMGWQLSNERQLKTLDGRPTGEMSLEFRKNGYRVSIDYAPTELDHGWNYGISVSWLLVGN